MGRLLRLIQANWIAVTLATLFGITVLSLWPQSELPDVPGGDKAHHVFAYAVLMFPVASRRPDRWIWFGLLFIVYGGVLELLQPLVNRYGTWPDFIANVVGVVAGVVIAALLSRMCSIADQKSSR